MHSSTTIWTNALAFETCTLSGGKRVSDGCTSSGGVCGRRSRSPRGRQRHLISVGVDFKAAQRASSIRIGVPYSRRGLTVTSVSDRDPAPGSLQLLTVRCANIAAKLDLTAQISTC